VSGIRIDKELEQYRNLMEVPSTFQDGFSWTSLVGAIFVAVLMVPGAMYMNLLAGQGVGPAAQWVTVILFIEVARRAHKHLSKPEIFVLFYMAGAAMQQPFSGLLYNQFFAQSQAATGMGVSVPYFYAPSDPDVLAQRSFFNPAWYPAVGLVIFQTLMSQINTMILSYGLFRLASDIEKLPFPMAPVGAQGITALAEQQTEESRREEDTQGGGSWRWRVFSIGGVLGLAFGAVYMALPAISTALLDEPITIIPIPFTELTQKTSDFLPAYATGINLNMGQLVFGMVMPFYAMLGSFLSLILMAIANPILYKAGYLPSWSGTDDTILTTFHNYIDFYFSFGLGLALAIATAGIFQVVRGVRARKRAIARAREAGQLEQLEQLDSSVPPGRGDIKFPIILAAYAGTTLAYIGLSTWLIVGLEGGWTPNVNRVLGVMLFFGFLYTPLLSYVTARLEGMAGQVVQIPFVREASFILSGYQGVAIWFLPVPIADYGQKTVFYRQAELTGTSFWSIWKTELMLVPIVILSSILFANFIWSLADIPGPQYPYAERMWELNAATQCIMYTATLGRHSQFHEAFRWEYIAAGTGVGLGLFAIMGLLHLPIMLMFGLVKGLNQATLPHVILPQFIGACIGRFYFEKRMGLKWRQYVPVVAAGFACGMGLVTVLGIGVNFLAKSVIKIPF